MSATDPVPPDTRPFSIRRLRPVWIGVLAVATVAVLQGYRSSRYHRESLAIQTVERLGGRCVCNGRGPRALGMSTIQGVEFHDRSVDDAILGGALRALIDLPDLAFLDLAGTSVSDSGVRQLTQCHNIRILNLCDTRISGRAVSDLCKMHSLVKLDIVKTQLGDSELGVLMDCPNLIVVLVGPNQVSPDILGEHRRGERTIQVLEVQEVCGAD